jgi:pyridoxine 4-dehydrogenase
MPGTSADRITLAGRDVSRLGYGTMQLTGPGVIGPPADLEGARQVLRRALELGVRAFDTSWYYGPDVPNELLAEAVEPYREEVVIATKLGWAWDDRGRLLAAHSPELLRAGMERDLGVFGAGAISIAHLRWGQDRSVSESFRRSLAAMIEMRDEGAFEVVGLSSVGLAQLEYALSETEIASVSNSFSVGDQADGELVDFAAEHGVACLPWLPLRAGSGEPARALGEWSRRLGVAPASVALAWLLQRAANIVPIPGTTSVEHLEENLAALEVVLPDDAVRELTAR